jgi:hypothetical protein
MSSCDRYSKRYTPRVAFAPDLEWAPKELIPALAPE